MFEIPKGGVFWKDGCTNREMCCCDEKALIIKINMEKVQQLSPEPWLDLVLWSLYRQQARNSQKLQTAIFLKKKSKWWRHTQSYITRRKGTIMHTGESPVRSIIIVRPSSKNIAPKCCIAIPSWTDSVWISRRIDASPVLPSCRIRCAMCWNIILGIHKCHKYFQGKFSSIVQEFLKKQLNDIQRKDCIYQFVSP